MRKSFVHAPVTDLRREPSARKLSYESDPLQESQLIYGEEVRILEKSGEWMRIEALEQRCFKERTWKGYPGWVLADHIIETDYPRPNFICTKLWTPIISEDGTLLIQLPFGTRLHTSSVTNGQMQVTLLSGQSGFMSIQSPPTAPSRDNLLALGNLFLGFPYLWGGRSAYQKDYPSNLTSVDCSGLVNLLYRAQGIESPRDAHDQFLWSKSIEPAALKKGDLIFFSKVENPKRMCHVMLYAGESHFLEATAASKDVRIISAEIRLGTALERLASGSHNGEYHIFYGTTDEF